MTARPSRTEDLGAFLLKQHKITGKQLAECLQTWNQHRTRGHVEALHELLVKRGAISMPGLSKLLADHELTLATCRGCGKTRVARGDQLDFCAECNQNYHRVELRTQHDGGASSADGASPTPLLAPTPERRPLKVDRYQIEKELGKGGMGEVVLAFDPVRKEHVAIKFLSLDLRGSQVPFKRFAREGRVLADTQHPHLVSTFDVNLTSDPPYLVMEYVDGQSFEQLLKSRNYDVRAALEMLAQAVEGVAAVHAHGIIHRDLKPANILIDKTGKAKVTDFGLAKVMDSNSMLTRTGQSIGTPAYMAPEQIKGELKLLGPATDIYALGVILYRVLVGQLPYEGLTMTEVLRRSLRDDVPAPESTIYKVSPALAAVCQRATKNAVDERYGDSATFLKDLRAALGMAPVDVPVPSGPLLIPDDASSSSSGEAPVPRKSGGCASILAALAGIAVWSWW